MARPEAVARDRYLGMVGAIPGVMVYRSEVLRGEHHQRSLPEGHPDVVVCVCGNVVLQEWKSATGRLRPGQEAFHRAWRAAGGTVWICRDPIETVGMMVPLATGVTRDRLVDLCGRGGLDVSGGVA